MKKTKTILVSREFLYMYFKNQEEPNMILGSLFGYIENIGYKVK